MCLCVCVGVCVWWGEWSQSPWNGSWNQRQECSVWFMKETANNRRRKILLVWEKAWSKEPNDMEMNWESFSSLLTGNGLKFWSTRWLYPWSKNECRITTSIPWLASIPKVFSHLKGKRKKATSAHLKRHFTRIEYIYNSQISTTPSPRHQRLYLMLWKGKF